MTDARWTIAEINGLDRDEFVARLGFLFEGSPWIAGDAWSARPFAQPVDLLGACRAAIDAAPAERRLGLIRAHPDLVGRAALAGRLGRASTGEQAAAGLDRDRLTPAEIAKFGELNRAYRERFGFPFVVCAREHTKDAILAGFAARLDNDREREIEVALGEIGRIGYHRLEDIVREEAEPGREPEVGASVGWRGLSPPPRGETAVGGNEGRR